MKHRARSLALLLLVSACIEQVDLRDPDGVADTGGVGDTGAARDLGSPASDGGADLGPSDVEGPRDLPLPPDLGPDLGRQDEDVGEVDEDAGPPDVGEGSDTGPELTPCEMEGGACVLPVEMLCPGGQEPLPRSCEPEEGRVCCAG